MSLDDGLSDAIWPAGAPAFGEPRGESGRAWRRPLRRAGRALLDAIFPPGCMACSAPALGSDGLCPTCWNATRFIAPPVCERLGVPLALDLGAGLLSPEAIAHPPVYRRARAVACFDEGPAQALVHRLKYGDRPDYARVLGRWMGFAGAALLAEADVIVPIPLHGRRLWHRRFNQAACLAQAVASMAGKPLDLDGLLRVKATQSQVGMTRAERAENVQGAFRIAEAAAARFRDRRILLIDDVLTTGATANAASRVLLRGGAAQVDVLVFARVVTVA